jgi:murein L,D-transpeptidase YafK
VILVLICSLSVFCFASHPARQPETCVYIEKAARRLTLYSGGETVISAPVGLGFDPIGDKTREGDGKTPLGEYYVCTKNSISKFYLSLGLSYPSEKDAQRGFEEGRIDEATRGAIVKAVRNGRQPPWDTPLGGEIMIHGHGSHSDWTLGCVAVENAVMDILFQACAVGTKVVITD